MTQQPQPDNSADWLDEILRKLSQYKDETTDNYITPQQAKAAILQHMQAREAEIRIDELNRLDTCRHYGKDYQDSMDELAEYKEQRIASLSQPLGGEKHERV